MSVKRTIYTQGSVTINGIGNAGVYAPWFLNSLTGNSGNATFLTLTGVQSANFTYNSPKLDVNSFGVLGPVNKVQVEPSTATLEIAMIINSGNNALDPHWLSGLMYDAQQPLPSGVVVTASGIGQVSGAVLTAVRMESAVGALPTITLTFDGVSGNNVLSAPAAPTVLSTAIVPVTTPDNFGSLYWSGVNSGCPQTIRVSWEMPVDRINCLGSPIDKPTIFTRPPGTMSFVAEGCDNTFIGSFLTGVQVGVYGIQQSPAAIRQTSQTANMAVGETVSTYNVTSEGIALGAVVNG